MVVKPLNAFTQKEGNYTVRLKRTRDDAMVYVCLWLDKQTSKWKVFRLEKLTPTKAVSEHDTFTPARKALLVAVNGVIGEGYRVTMEHAGFKPILGFPAILR